MFGTCQAAGSAPWRDRLTVFASGPIEEGDAVKFAALPKFETLELDSPGGLVIEALQLGNDRWLVVVIIL
jgi:hypothetical protein